MAKRTGKTQRAGGSPGTPRGKRGLSKADQQTGAGLLRRRAAFTAPLLARQEAGSPQRAVFESVTRRYRQALMPTLGRASASANLVADILLRYQTLGLAVPQSSRPALTSNREFFQMLLGLGLLQPPQPVGRGRQVQGPDQQPDEQLDTLLYPPAHADTAPEEQEAFLRRASIIFAPEPTSIAAPITRTSAVAMTGGRLRLGERLGERRFWQPAFGARGAIQLGTGLRVAVDAQSTELQADREPPPPAFTNLPGVMGLLASVQRHAYTGSQSLTSDEQSNALASIQRSLASGTPRVLAGSTISFLGRALGEGAPNPSIFDDTDAQDAARALQSDAFTYGGKIFFGSQFQEDSADSLKLLAHEMAHVARQSSDADPSSMGYRLGAGDSLEGHLENEAVAWEDLVNQFLQGTSAGRGAQGIAGTRGGARTQRQPQEQWQTTRTTLTSTAAAGGFLGTLLGQYGQMGAAQSGFGPGAGLPRAVPGSSPTMTAGTVMGMPAIQWTFPGGTGQGGAGQGGGQSSRNVPGGGDNQISSPITGAQRLAANATLAAGPSTILPITAGPGAAPAGQPRAGSTGGQGTGGQPNGQGAGRQTNVQNAVPQNLDWQTTRTTIYGHQPMGQLAGTLMARYGQLVEAQGGAGAGRTLPRSIPGAAPTLAQGAPLLLPAGQAAAQGGAGQAGAQRGIGRAGLDALGATGPQNGAPAAGPLTAAQRLAANATLAAGPSTILPITAGRGAAPAGQPRAGSSGGQRLEQLRDIQTGAQLGEGLARSVLSRHGQLVEAQGGAEAGRTLPRTVPGAPPTLAQGAPLLLAAGQAAAQGGAGQIGAQRGIGRADLDALVAAGPQNGAPAAGPSIGAQRMPFSTTLAAGPTTILPIQGQARGNGTNGAVSSAGEPALAQSAADTAPQLSDLEALVQRWPRLPSVASGLPGVGAGSNGITIGRRTPPTAPQAGSDLEALARYWPQQPSLSNGPGAGLRTVTAQGGVARVTPDSGQQMLQSDMSDLDALQRLAPNRPSLARGSGVILVGTPGGRGEPAQDGGQQSADMPEEFTTAMEAAARNASAPALASGISGATLAAAGALQAQAAGGEDHASANAAGGSDHYTHTNVLDLPVDLDDLADQILMRIKRQLALDHDRSGGFLSDLLH